MEKCEEGTKRGLGQKEFPRGESFRLSPRKRTIAEGDKMVKGANRVVSSVLFEFFGKEETFQRLSLICLFVRNETNSFLSRSIWGKNGKGKRAKLICVLINI